MPTFARASFRRLPVSLALLAVATSRPSAQALTWVRLHTLPPAVHHAMVYDPVHARVMWYGGFGHGSFSTWQWDGAAVAEFEPADGPEVYDTLAMAYDVTRHRAVLFGGVTYRPAQTWEWDGLRWTALQPTVSPPPRLFGAMAYDAGQGRTILYGGGDVQQPRFDVWAWDGATWAELPGGPPSRTGHAMAYDPMRQRLVVFGGLSYQVPHAETWEWDGNSWRQLTPAVSPPARMGHAMVYDAHRQRLVVFGGTGVSGALSDTWAFDGSTWTLLATTGPAARTGGAMAYDAARDAVVLQGGGRTPYDAHFSDLWEFDGSAWRPMLANQAPEPSRFPGAAYDATRGRTVLFGGANSGGGPVAAETWEFDDWRWHQVPTTVAPAARYGHRMAFDTVRSRTVLFGGLGRDDTWEWDGTQWTDVSPPTAPGAREAPAMAFDRGRGRTVLFGGSNGTSLLDDTWEWDGSTWTRRGVAGPPRRSFAAMAYDEARRETVLFGGVGSTGLALDDTWVWDASAWTQRNPAVHPMAGARHAMAYDAARRVVVLRGIQYVAPPGIWETWEWDGSTWTLASTSGFLMQEQAMVYSERARRVLAIGGFVVIGSANVQSDVWGYGANVSPGDTEFGAGCGGSGGTPRLATGVAYVGNPAFALRQDTTVASTAAAILLAAQAGNVSVGPCTFYVGQPIVGVATATNVFGAAEVHLTIPADSVLRGQTLYAQGAALDITSPTGFALSAGHRIVLGD